MGAVIAIDRPKSRARVVEEAGRIQAKIDGECVALQARLKPDQERLDALKAQMQGWGDEVDADKSYVEESENYLVKASPREFQRKIVSPLKAYKALKMSLTEFLSQIKIPLSLIDKHVPEKKQSAFLTKERTGSRKIEIIAKGHRQAA